MGLLDRLLIVALAGLALSVPGRAEAQRTIKCESQGDARHLCSVPNLNESSVRVTKKLSDSPCIQGRSWGTVNNNIWVAQGCRAEFSYAYGGGGSGGAVIGGSGVRKVTCASEGDARHACSVPGLNVASVQILNRLSKSACIKGTSWGAAANAIWVSKGCRAEFSYRLN